MNIEICLSQDSYQFSRGDAKTVKYQQLLPIESGAPMNDCIIMKLLFAVLLTVTIIIQGAYSIKGGQKIEPEQFPYAVTIWTIHDGIPHNGVIITPRFILATGQTVLITIFVPSAYIVQAGMVRRNQGLNDSKVQTRPVLSILRHPGYSVYTHSNHPGSVLLKNDIALLKVAQPFETTPAVQPIAIRPYAALQSCTICQVSGWNYEDPNQQLQVVQVVIAEGHGCDGITPQLLEDQLCGATLHSDDRLNFMDQGNPVICNGGLVGIVDTLNIESTALWTLRSIRPHFDFIQRTLIRSP